MSTPQGMSRKRPAPGASPAEYPSQLPQAQNNYSQPGQSLTDDQFFNWGANGQGPDLYPNPPTYNTQQNSHLSQAVAQSQNQPNQSNQIARRPPNSQMVTRPQPHTQWTVDQQTASQQLQQQQETPTTWSDDINELLTKAQVAKREAQSKRKQIPPFVLKLHSFLENPKNTDLIRWANDGRSFVVLNEDEFANKLIPELFKHNNYASFVRQLNMYGFHKKVGLSDNSMRASERKAKTPSEYYNPFFRKGYPDLLWLIQKPKNQTPSTKPRPGGKSEERDEEEHFAAEPDGNSPYLTRPQLSLPGPLPNNSALTQEQFSTVQRELMMIRRQQGQITHMLGQLKQEHDALVNQANDYQNKHSRHEHSINAILTFLATLYNRSLQNHEGAQDIAKIFASALNQDKNGGGVDVNNFVFDLPEGNDQSQPAYKRQRLLLTDGSEGRATTASPATSAASPLPRSSRRSSHMARSPQSAHVEEIFDDANNPTQNYHHPSDQQQQDMMSLIHNTNARNSGNNTPVPDFSHVLNDLESTGGTTSFSAAQRENMLRMFNDQSKRPPSNGSDTKALVSPARSNSQLQFDNKLASTKTELDQLAQLQAAQDQSVEKLTSLLQPLSPSGSIPGIGDGQEIPPAPLDIETFLGHDYFSDYNNAANGNYDFSDLNNGAYNSNGNNANFDFTDSDPLFEDADDRTANGNFLTVADYDEKETEGRVESVATSSGAPTPKTNISDTGGVDWDGSGHVLKKRRNS